MTLDEVAIGDSCVVSKLGEVGEIRRRILDMGITEGAHVKVCKVPPLGDPIELTVRGYQLSLRKSDAASIEVQPA